ncbi:MAG: hypothetical protein GX605_01785 [Chloroflexi bacterium]|nr:hypothetical protein [Chloroflexota bacterium]
MNAKERVLAAIAHQEPDRVPLDFVSVPEQMGNLRRHFGLPPKTPDANAPVGIGEYVDSEVAACLGTDLRNVAPKYVGPPTVRYDDGSFLDFWGVRRKPVRHATGVYNEVIDAPLKGASSLQEVDRHRWPSVEWFDFKPVTQQCREQSEYALVAGWPMTVDFINRSAMLCGYDRVLLGLATGDPVVFAILDRLSDFFLKFNQRYFEAGQGYLDIAFYGDDYGTQGGSLISPRTFRSIFQPRWAPHMEQVRSFGLKAMLHSCGSTRVLLPDIIDTGFHILQTVQPEAKGMDLHELKEQFGDRLCFNGCISVQQVLPHTTPDGVRAEVRRVIEIMAPGGGFILGPTHNIQSDTPLENVLAMYETAQTVGVYPRRSA